MRNNIHPIEHIPKGLDEAARFNLIESFLAQCWDQIWWLSLPFYKKFYYWIIGYRAPISKFYNES